MIDIDALLACGDGLILARHHRRLKSSLSRWVHQGRLARVMRGVYAHPDLPQKDRIRAALVAIPGAVIADDTALALASQRNPQIDTIQVCTPTRRVLQKGYRFTRRVIPREQVEPNGLMSPTLAAVDVCDKNPFWLDELARLGAATCDDYQLLLSEHSHRRGNPARRKHIARTSTNPWAKSERGYHDLFDLHKIKGWVANQTLHCGGATYIPDIMFRKEKLIVEIDGRDYHTDPVAFENDRLRNNDLVSAGWTILHFTWQMLADPDRIIATLTATLARLRRAARRQD